MKITKTFLLLMAALSVSLLAKDAPTTQHTLTVSVNGFRNSQGNFIATLYNRDGSIPDEKFQKFYMQKKATITNNASAIVFKNLPAGDYAVGILHDENSNGKIDKGLLLPVEGVGFSNFNSIGLTNKPNFRKASFNLNSDKKISIKLIYF